MRAKYLNKTARRRTVRPDGDHYREMRKWRGESRLRTRNQVLVLAGLILAAGLVVWAVYAIFFRS